MTVGIAAAMLALYGAAGSSALRVAAQAPPAPAADKLAVPTDYFKLKNGLKVVLSRDTTTPTVVVALYYNIGFRNEPKDRTGFAHLFEHMMFQGSQNLGKMEFIRLVESNGGAPQRLDALRLHELLRGRSVARARDRAVGRGRSHARPRITPENLKNQQEVVKNEVRVNVLNQPYGGFPWIDLPMSRTELVQRAQFLRRPGGPRRGDARGRAAVLQDVLRAEQRRAGRRPATSTPAQAKAWIEKYFADIPRRRCRRQPDSRSRGRRRRSARRSDGPARAPPGARHRVPRAGRNTPEYYAMGLIDQILAQGNDSLYQELVQKRGLTGGVDGGINSGLGNMFNYNGPMLWIASALPRHGQRRPTQILGRSTTRSTSAAQDAGRSGDARSGAGEDALGALRRPRAVRRLRPRRPARVLRALRRRPGADQPARGRVPPRSRRR